MEVSFVLACGITGASIKLAIVARRSRLSKIGVPFLQQKERLQSALN
jgi:hypothetical protein